MAVYNGNDISLTFNAVDVAARWRSFDLTLNSGDEDVTAGTGVDWEAHATKLFNASGTIILVYDDTAAAAAFAALWDVDMVIPIVYGPEGSATGKPCHNQSFKINSIKGPTTNVDKTLVTLEYDVVSSGTPTKNIWAGDTF